MYFSTAVAALSVAALVAAQDQQVIQVGSTADAPGGIFQFIPPSINATNGTVVTFRFTGAPGNHSITQSTFANPCQPMSGGFDSGWVFIPPNNVSETPEWNLTITNSSTPLWFYCKQLVPSPHCQAGMVGAINAPATGNTFEGYQNNARSSSGTPGQGVGALVGHGASASAPPGPITGGASAFGVPSATAPPGGSATGSGNAPAPTNTNGAQTLVAGSLTALLSAVLGITLM